MTNLMTAIQNYNETLIIEIIVNTKISIVNYLNDSFNLLDSMNTNNSSYEENLLNESLNIRNLKYIFNNKFV